MDYIEDIAIPFFKQHNFPSTIYTYPEGIENISDVPILINGLESRG